MNMILNQRNRESRPSHSPTEANIHNPQSAIRNPQSQQAFSLVEVTLALGVAGFCLTTLLSLLPLGLTSNQTSLEQTMAGNLGAAIVADLRCAQSVGAGTSPHFGIPIPAPPTSAGATQTSGTTIYLSASGIASTNGQVVSSGTSVSRYRATVAFYFPSSGQYSSPVAARTATAVRVLITWPAMADATPAVWQLGSSPTWPANYTGSYEADTTLDRN